MKPFQELEGLLLVVMALGTIGSVFAGANYCTPDTCTGPVVLHFSRSNCTGDITYEEVNVQYDVCEDGQLNYKDENGITFYSYGGVTPTCDRDAANATYGLSFYRWGACQPNFGPKRSGLKPQARSQFSSMYGGFMYLASVNDSYVAPQTFDNQPLAAYRSSYVDCYSTDNCTLANGQPSSLWTTYYPALTCQNPGHSSMNSYEALGECLNYYNITYVKNGCFDSKGFFTSYYTDASCTKLAYVYAYRSDCAENSYPLRCTAPATPIPNGAASGAPSPTSPTSNASHSQVSSILLLIAFAVLSLVF